jgi:hypothetical protein
MELEKLDTIAQQLFEILPESLWRGKGADEIEGESQKVVSQIGNRVMGQHVMAARITELEREVEEGVWREVSGAQARGTDPSQERIWDPRGHQDAVCMY